MGAPNLMVVAQKDRPQQSWASLDIQVYPYATAMFSIVIETQVVNWSSTLFWSDRWLMGYSVQDIAPSVVAAVLQNTRTCRTVTEALQA